MSDTNVMVTEGKKISDLPVSLGFSDNAVVLIVDGGKTAQMNLAVFVQEIVRKTAENSSSLKKKIEEMESSIGEQEKNYKNLADDLKSYKQSVTNRFTSERKDFNAMSKELNEVVSGLDAIRYCEELYDYSMMTERGNAYSTGNAIVGTKFGFVLGGNGTGYFGCTVNVKAGWRLTMDECQEFTPLSDSRYLVVTDVDGYILALIPVQDFLQEGYVYEFGQDGAFVLSAQCNLQNMELPLFKLLKHAVGVPKATQEDNNKTLQVVNGRWAAVDALAIEDGNEVAY